MSNEVDMGSMLRRAYRDTERCLGFLWYQVVLIMITAISSITTAFFYFSNPTPKSQVIAGIVTAIVIPFAILGLTFFIAFVSAPYRQRNEARKQLAELKKPNILQAFFDPSNPNCISRFDDYDKQIFFDSFRIGIRNTGTTSMQKVKVNLVKCDYQSSEGTITQLNVRSDILMPFGTSENGTFELSPNMLKYVTVFEYPDDPYENEIYIKYFSKIEYTTSSLVIQANAKYLFELILTSENTAQVKCIFEATTDSSKRISIQLKELK
jgi:hypothetical protein